MQIKPITGTRKPDPKVIAAISAAIDAFQESKVTVEVTERPAVGIFKLRSESLWKKVGLLELLAARDLGNKL